MPKWVSLKFLAVPIIIAVLECVIYYKMFFYSGYVQFGNFEVPLKENLFGNFSVVSWDPFDYLGLPFVFPWLNVLSNFSYVLLFLFGVFKKSKKLFLVKLPLSSSEKYSMNTK